MADTPEKAGVPVGEDQTKDTEGLRNFLGAEDVPRADRKGETTGKKKPAAKKKTTTTAKKKAAGDKEPAVTQKKKTTPRKKPTGGAKKKVAETRKKQAADAADATAADKKKAAEKTAADKKKTAPKKRTTTTRKPAADTKKKAPVRRKKAAPVEAAPAETGTTEKKAEPAKKAPVRRKKAAPVKKTAAETKKKAPVRRKMAAPKKAATQQPPINPDEVLGEPRAPRASTMPGDVMDGAKDKQESKIRLMTTAELAKIAGEAAEELQQQTETAKTEQGKDVTDLVTKEELEGLWDAYVDHFGESGELATEYGDARAELQQAATKLAELREAVPAADATGPQRGAYKRKLKNAQKKLFEAEDAFFDMREKVAEHYDGQLRQVMEEQLTDHMAQHRDFYAGQISEAEQRLEDANALKAALEDAQAKGIKELSIPEDADFEAISGVLDGAVEANNVARAKKAEQYAKTLLSVKFWTVPDEATGKTLSQDDVIARRRTLQTLERTDPDLYQQTREAAKSMLENGDYDYQQAVLTTREEAVEADQSTSAIKRMGAEGPKV